MQGGVTRLYSLNAVVWCVFVSRPYFEVETLGNKDTLLTTDNLSVVMMIRLMEVDAEPAKP